MKRAIAIVVSALLMISAAQADTPLRVSYEIRDLGQADIDGRFLGHARIGGQARINDADWVAGGSVLFNGSELISTADFTGVRDFRAQVINNSGVPN